MRNNQSKYYKKDQADDIRLVLTVEKRVISLHTVIGPRKTIKIHTISEVTRMIKNHSRRKRIKKCFFC